MLTATETGGQINEGIWAHGDRLAAVAVAVAGRLGLSADLVERLRFAAPLHDIGKAALPATVLLKPGPLTVEETALVRTHVHEGARLLGGGGERLRTARAVALSHHERWDGKGYPRGLRGEDIPLAARIVAVADVFDALISERPYKAAWTNDAAIAEIERESGSQFDPKVVEAFLELPITRDGRAGREPSGRWLGARRGGPRRARRSPAC